MLFAEDWSRPDFQQVRRLPVLQAQGLRIVVVISIVGLGLLPGREEGEYFGGLFERKAILSYL